MRRKRDKEWPNQPIPARTVLKETPMVTLFGIMRKAI
jgi:hypothetical protein